MKSYTMFINGKSVGADKTFQVINPANQNVIANVPLGGKKEARLAIAAAKKAFPAWSCVPDCAIGEDGRSNLDAALSPFPRRP